MSAGDTDLVCTARAAGLGFGTFPQLRLRASHPSRRDATQDYLLKLVEGIAFKRPARAKTREGGGTGWRYEVIYPRVGVFVTKGSRGFRLPDARNTRGVDWQADVLLHSTMARLK